MSETESNKEIVEPEIGFRFHEQLEVAIPDIEKWFTPFEGSVYRTFIGAPPIEKDFTPQALREPDGKALVQGGLSKEEYDTLSKGQRKQYVSDRTLSVNDSREHAEQAAVSNYKSVKEKWGTEYAEMHMEEDRGSYIGEVVLPKGVAWISKFDKKGHGEIILNQDISWEDIEVRNIIKYQYKDE